MGSPPSTNTGIAPGTTLNVSLPCRPQTSKASRLVSYWTPPSKLPFFKSSMKIDRAATFWAAGT